jgi:hypothetical protein
MMKAILLAIVIGMLALPALGAEISVQLGSRNVEKGISSPSGADGVQEALTIAGRDCRALAPGNAYFYFHVERPEALPKSGPLSRKRDVGLAGFMPLRRRSEKRSVRWMATNDATEHPGSTDAVQL